MIEIEEKSRNLFMKFALPCAGTLIQRGSVSQQFIDELRIIVKNNEKIPKDAEKIFKVAMASCSLLAIDQRKKFIDEKIIHEYFLFKHDNVIDSRYEEMGDFDPNACRTRAGKINLIEKDLAVVENSFGINKYKLDFVPEVKKNDLVVTHWDYIVEKIDKKTAQEMQKQKQSLRLR